jgi:hypothetical protein
MSGLLRRLTRRRPATADETGSATTGSSEPAGASADTPAEAGGGQPVPGPGDQPTNVLPRTGDEPGVAPQPGDPRRAAAGSAVSAQPGAERGAAPAGEQAKPGAQPPAEAAVAGTPAVATPERPAPRDLPAGVDPAELESGPIASARRGKLRRRLRYLRRVRELLLRDLGGFTYELHRTAGGAPSESHRRLAVAKADRIGALDAEVRDIESRLGQPHAEPMLREPGVGGTCPECGELHASDARFCSRCGTPLDERARAQRAAEIAAAAPPTTHEQPTPEPGPASVLWAAGPRPSTSAEPTADSPRPSASTSEWLAGRDRPSEPGQPAGESGPTGEPARPDAPGRDEPASADSSAAPDDAPAPTDEAPGEPEAAAGSAADEPEQPGKENPGFEPNGRRDEDVPPPVRSRDPLGSRGEQRP